MINRITAQRKHKKQPRSNRIRIWNVRSLYPAGKLNNVILEMARLKVNVLGLAEIRCTCNGNITHNGMTIIYSGGDKHESSVGVFLDKNFLTVW